MLCHNATKIICLILLISFILNVWGISWGTPSKWNPDEGTFVALKMIKEKSLNPHRFAYGSLHYYQIIISIAPVLILNNYVGIINNNFENKKLLMVSSRFLSVLFGVFTVLLIYRVSSHLFDKHSALVSSILLAISMGFVNLSHFATTDIPSIFWYTFSCLMSVLILRDGCTKYYILGGVFAGLAAAVKYNVGIALIPLITAHLLSDNKKLRNIILCVFTTFTTFLISNPVILFSFCEFSEAFLNEQFFNSVRNINTPKSFLKLIINLKHSMGLPLFITSMLSLAYSIKFLSTNEYRDRILLVWSMIIPYYLIMGSTHFSPLRYSVFLIPFIMIFAGKMLRDFHNMCKKSFRVIYLFLISAVLIYSFLYTTGALLKFTNDSRKLALRWVNKNIPENTRIGIDKYGQNIPSHKYTLLLLPNNPNVESAISYTYNSPVYQYLSNFLSEAHLLAESIGLCNGQQSYYTTWYDKSSYRYKKSVDQMNNQLTTGELNPPEYLVVTERYIRTARDIIKSNNKELTEISFYEFNYKAKVVFEYKFLPGIDPKPEFVNPKVYVYKLEV